MKISQSSVNIHKNALYAIAVNSIQIVAAVVLAALLVIEKNNLAIDIFSSVIAVVVTAGAALDIREAMAPQKRRGRYAQRYGGADGRAQPLPARPAA